MVGQAYERSFGSGLVFGLRPATDAPPNQEGWTIEVREERGEHDFVWVATPPYRFANPRDLTTSYGMGAREVIEWDRRLFGFVTGEEEYQALAEVVSRLRWSGSDTTEAAQDSVRILWQVPSPAGRSAGSSGSPSRWSSVWAGADHRIREPPDPLLARELQDCLDRLEGRKPPRPTGRAQFA